MSDGDELNGAGVGIENPRRGVWKVKYNGVTFIYKAYGRHPESPDEELDEYIWGKGNLPRDL